MLRIANICVDQTLKTSLLKMSDDMRYISRDYSPEPNAINQKISDNITSLEALINQENFNAAEVIINQLHQDIANAAGQQSLKCDFCGETTDILKEETELPVIDEIKSIVPFTVDKNSLVSVTQNYMISGALTPDDLLENSVITKQSLYYVPTYLFSGNYEANWTASFGYYRKEQDNDNKTKIVTDWRQVSGIDNGNFQVPVYAGSMLPGNVSELIQADDLNKKLTPFKQEFLIGCDVELFSIKEKDAYDNHAKPILDKIIDAGVKEHKQGYIQQNWQWTVKFDKEITDTVLMPIAHSIFEYKGKEYHVWVDGSGSSKIIADEPPKDNSRQNAFALGYIPILISLIARRAARLLHPAAYKRKEIRFGAGNEARTRDPQLGRLMLYH
ncbi:hypothetical protein CHS0354_001984 [Potamilus streckersoni]|uniref:Uncharacterized protein n=1 Tax=Potamilus streckersoni TaxID=2493646 RepID=A0AAE0T5L0_9BIVA|nr:hypothetical protein CHS0354_001984 [Potamilus streckersoni]